MKLRLFSYWEKKKKKISSLRREDSDVRQDLDAKQKHLRELRDSKTNAFKRFGQHMPSLLEEVEIAYRQGQFKHKPVGPLGKNDSFSAFSRQFLGFFLMGFIEELITSTVKFRKTVVYEASDVSLVWEIQRELLCMAANIY